MNTNDTMRHRCVNNQLCEQLCVKLHREPPKKWHIAVIPIMTRPDVGNNTPAQLEILKKCGLA